MTEQLNSALINGALLAMMFPNTRNIGILAAAALAFLYPKPILMLVLLGAVFYLYRRIYSK